MKTSPTQRTLAECKKRGWIAQVTERWNQFAKVRQDLFGGIDLIALADGECIGIQATSGTNHAARVAKLRAEPRLAAWVKAGNKLQVWSWSQRGERGKRKLWTLRVETVEYFVSVEEAKEPA